MKKVLVLLLMSLLAIDLTATANPVDMQTARDVAMKFINANAKTSLRGIQDLQLVATWRTENNAEAFHVFNTATGFVIVSADDCAIPILGYSDEGRFDTDNIPIQMRDYLDRFAAQIQYGVDNQIPANAFTAQQWENVRKAGCLSVQKSNLVVEPLLTSRWNQNYPYNRFCPTAPGGPGNHAYAGCVAVAMGQIMRFWGYPETGQGSYGGVNFGNTTYQWNQMFDAIPNDPDISEIRPIATLLWHCGVAVDMQYSASGSGADVADVPNAMVTYFKYSNNMQHEYKECEGDVYYTDSQWIEKIKNCLNIGRPILYGAADDNIGMGHAFVCDGYDGNDMLHFNWGWSGAGNAYFSLGALNVTSGTGYNYYFNTCNSAIFNIHPATSPEAYDIAANADPAEGGMVSGAGTYLEGQTCTLTATANEGFTFVNWTENGNEVSTEAVYSFTVMAGRDLVANFGLPLTIPGYGTGAGNYRFIASPLSENTAPATVEGMTVGTNYDLYRFDQGEALEWQNYKAHADDFMLVNGQGYLYANAEEVNLVFKGTFNEDVTKEESLVYDTGKDCAGWNLVGNPFPTQAYVDRSYYVMNEEGTAIEPVTLSAGTAIPVCTGVMVKAENTGETVVFSRTPSSKSAINGSLQITVVQEGVNAAYDKAIVSFNEGEELEKMVFNEGKVKLYIPKDGKDYAIAYAQKQEEIPLYFKTTENGNYTLKIYLEGLEMGYLHLIDTKIGAEVDLLQTPSYTFEAQSSDDAVRFKLVFKP